MASIDASTSGAGGIITTADNTGTLNLQSGGVTKATISSSGLGINGDIVSPYIGYKNKIINGNFDIWQRGTSVSTTSSFGYAADRWRCGGTMTASRQTFTVGQTEVPNNPKYYMRVNVTADSMNYEFQQRIEGVQTLSGQSVTVSYYARRTSGTVTTGLNLIQDFGGGGSPSSVVVTNFAAPSYTTSWQKFTSTVTLPSISGKTLGTNGDDNLYLSFQFSNTGTGVIEIAQVQLEQGSSATSFEARSLQQELALCQRYYQRLGSDLLVPLYNESTTSGRAIIPYPVTMRAAPTSLEQSGTASDYSVRTFSSGKNLTSVPSLDRGTINNITITCTVSGGVGAAGGAGNLNCNTANGFLGWSAEFV